MSLRTVVTKRNELNSVFTSLLLSILIISSAGLFIYTHRTMSVHALNLASSHHPEMYSELYFDDSSHLPTSAGQNVTKNFSFRITNHEASSINYHYVATMIIKNDVTTLSDGYISLSDGQSADKKIDFKITQPHAQAVISVSLVDRSEYIQFRTQS